MRRRFSQVKAEGINKNDLMRILIACVEWTDKYGGVILGQLKKLGASCDWEELNLPWIQTCLHQ
jgi:valyl-tRNA synthetase